MMTRREALASSAAILAFCPFRPHELTAAGEIPAGPTPTDTRLGPPKTLNDYFPFAVPKTKVEWAARRKQLREQVLVAEGLWPMPEKPPLNAVIHGPIERDGYTIEKVSFTSTPGHYVTGNLYRPMNGDGKKPAVLFAHGHWANGRFHDAGERAAKASVDAGGESDLDRGRYFMQALPASLARLGFVVFQYDMVGYADSTAIPHREGFKDAQAELRLQSFMGLQTWNSIRALDFLLSLPDVDAKHVGMTGASGGGTQTFLLGAIDDRLTAIFPAVMVSTAMQGGCVCENASHLRVGTGNIELAGLFAPKPLAMSAANDWTKALMTKGYPELQSLYELHGVKNDVAARAWLEFGHQYNQKAREFMYTWFNQHLRGSDKPATESPFKPVVPPTDLSVYDARHPRPKDELGAAELREKLAFASDDQMAKLYPNAPERLKPFREVVGTALRVMVNDELPREVVVRSGPQETKTDGLVIRRVVLGRKTEADAVPGVSVSASNFKGDRFVVWLHPNGKASLFEAGKLVPAARDLVAAGVGILAPDLFRSGELAAEKPFPVDKNYAGFTYGYNRGVLANRVHDALTYIAFARSLPATKSVALLGSGTMGPVAVLAKALAGDGVAKTAADLNGFRFEDVTKTDDPMMLPGALKYGGMAAFIALCAPAELLIHNNKKTGIGKLSKAAYDAAGAAGKLTLNGDKLDDAKVVQWLLK